MNYSQIIYVLALAAIFAYRGPSSGLWIVLGNTIATLGVCLAMDLGLSTRGDATIYMMLIDCMSGAALVVRPGINRVAALGYAVTVPLYSASILFEAPENTTFAVIYVIIFAQLGVFCIGGSGGNGLRSRRRLHNRFRNFAPSRRFAFLVGAAPRMASRVDRMDG